MRINYTGYIKLVLLIIVHYHVDKKSLLDLTWDRWSQGILYLWSIFILSLYLHLYTNYVLKWDAISKLRVELQLYAFLTSSLRMVWSVSPARCFISQYTRDKRMGRSAIASMMFFSKIKPQLMSSELECTLHYSLLRRQICKQKSTIFCCLYMHSLTHCRLHIYPTQIPCFSFNPPKNVYS
jgi:hypothetical protein